MFSPTFCYEEFQTFRRAQRTIQGAHTATTCIPTGSLLLHALYQEPWHLAFLYLPSKPSYFLVHLHVSCRHLYIHPELRHRHPLFTKQLYAPHCLC